MSEFSDSESDQSEFDSELDIFLKKLFVDEDDGDEDDINNPVDTETHLTSHIMESLGALLQTVVKADKALKKVDQNNPDLKTHQAKRQAFGCALRYFADKLQQPVAPQFSEPYPEKWLHSSFPDSQKAINGNSWLPLHWLVKASTMETCNDNPEVIQNINLVITDLHQLQEDLDVSNEFHYSVAPLSITVAQAHPSIDVVKCLCTHYPKALQMADADGAYPFFYACAWNKDTSIVEYLHSEFPKILDKCDNYGFRALHYAAYVGTVEMIQFLLVSDPSAAKQPNKYGVLPLNACIVNPNSGMTALYILL
jgi:ankyrin repeat protein